ncbi:DUF885 domain-containing protein [Nocardiopsis ansamitocini]|uniref:DUF885 domain-containing protein n=1 Tax=Nocardiopsis ansamitocini TaxID=1670832 RepID=A0A9W6P6I1_9ACTN|nr:DUF885 domain-containing protein [Nocardiopsis ansamitocini]GLU48090.1 hypothetical protein Nans01_24410 [Nocardiopsis ansamitocini]
MTTPEPQHPDPGANAMTDRFRDVAEKVLDRLLFDDPEWADGLGDHRFADRLPDYSEGALADRADTLADALRALDDIDDTLLSTADQVDLETLRTRVSADRWRLTELRPHDWDPLHLLPGDALSTLVGRDRLPRAERLDALAARCAAIPDFLRHARERLASGPGMPRVHVETAIGRTHGAVGLLGEELDRLLAGPTAPPAALGSARDAARQALTEHAEWLAAEAPAATADPRLGARDYAAQLWYALDSPLSPETLLTRAESDLIATEDEIAEVAAEYDARARYPGQVREVLDRLAVKGATNAADVRSLCERALEHLRTRTDDLGLVSVTDDPVRVIDMPETRRGVAVAYCDPPGPLGPAGAAPTLVAVAPPPEDWPVERQESFYREYNAYMLRNLMVHEGTPGHALQLAHSARYRGPTRVRSALGSGSFIEGWAVYAEELLAYAGWGGGEDDLALRLVQLKMRLRMILNAILDVRTHTGDVDEEEALRLLTERGHQEEGEAAGKWRRSLLTSAQLSTYYVGYREVNDVARDLAAARPHADQRAVHDEMLAFGSPSPRHLRTLLGLA